MKGNLYNKKVVVTVHYRVQVFFGGICVKAELKKNSLNQVIKDSEIFCEGDPVTDIGLVIKGRVRVVSEGINVLVGTGNFLGICDLETKVHNVTYIAETDLAIYTIMYRFWSQH